MNLALFSQSILGLPRLTRIFIVMIFSVAITMLIFAPVDNIYLQNFFDESTLMLPSLVSVAGGLLMYMAGWILIIEQYRIKTQSEPPKITFIYLVCGILAFMINLILIIQGLTIAL
ncbi:MAG: hypothetical protein ACPG7F_04245 [Aggregatilineales bacterium]